MLLAKVKGNVVSSHKNKELTGHKLLLIHPIDLDGAYIGEKDIIAIDLIGSGIGNTVIVTQEGSAVKQILKHDRAPVHTIILAQCTTYLAASPKSNAAYMGIEKAAEDVKYKPLYGVPIHLRNAPTSLMKEIGYGKDYKYPHDFENHFLNQQYLPEELKDRQYYFPSESGQEKTLKERLKLLWSGKKKY